MKVTTKPDVLRLFFRGSTALDETIRNARPMSRYFLLRQFAEEGWRLKGPGGISVDPADLARGRFPGAEVVSVRYVLDGDSPLAKHLRSLPSQGRAAQCLRMETLRSLASAGLAAVLATGTQQSTRAMPMSDRVPEKRVSSEADGSEPGRVENLSHLPFGRFGDEVTLA